MPSHSLVAEPQADYGNITAPTAAPTVPDPRQDVYIQHRSYKTMTVFTTELVSRFHFDFETATVISYLDRYLRTLAEKPAKSNDIQISHGRHWVQQSFPQMAKRLRCLSAFSVRQRLLWLQEQRQLPAIPIRTMVVLRGRNAQNKQKFVWSFAVPFLEATSDILWYSWYWTTHRAEIARIDSLYQVEILSDGANRVISPSLHQASKSVA